MSEKEKKESTSSEGKISRRSMLKWTGGLAAAAVVGAGIGYEAGLLQPAPPTSIITTVTGKGTVTVSAAEKVTFNIAGSAAGSYAALGGMWVYVKNGRIIRLRPARSPPNNIQKTWTITAGGQTFTEGPRAGRPRVAPYVLTLRRRVYDPRRIKYPMKRADWSATNRNTQNRGKSKFVRISWDEALTTIASELKRANDTYGPSSIMQTYFSHDHPGGIIQEKYRSVCNRVLCMAFGGYTALDHSPDSWEGWVFGGSWVWGYAWTNGLAPKTDVEDTMKNSKLIVNWCFDQLGQAAEGQYQVIEPWFRQLGIQRVHISPELARSAAAYADNWIPIIPATDGALACAIANVWITEGTYDKDYIATHTVGFDKFKNYITGGEDGVAKTPEWAEPITGVKARIIRALAREWASKPTMIGGLTGTICRVAYSHEITRLIALLLPMQGVGKPGHGWSGLSVEPANPSTIHKKPTSYGVPEVWGDLNWTAKVIATNNVPQFVWKTALPDAILNPPIGWHGMGLTGYRTPPPGVIPWYPHKDFDNTKFGGPGTNAEWPIAACPNTYPLKGYSEVHVMMMAGSFMLGCWNGGGKLIQAYQSPKIEFVFRLDYWWGGETIFSDILLPSATHFERNDIATGGPNAGAAAFTPKAIEPMWESKSDFDIEGLLADKLGVLDKVHEGLDELGWCEKAFNYVAASEYISFADFKNIKGTYPEGVLPGLFQYPWNPLNKAPLAPSRGLGGFADNPTLAANALNTKSGLIEFESGYLNDWFPGDKIRQPVPHYWTNWEGLESPLAKKYTLIVESPHPTFRLHTQYAENAWLSEIPMNRTRIGGYAYESLWMNPKDAAARGIQNGDIVRVFNDRGQILCAAYVNEKMMPGVVRSPDGGYYDPIDPGNPASLDKGGAMNFLCPHQYCDGQPDMTSDTKSGAPYGAPSPTWSGYMVEVEKYTKAVPDSASEVRIKEGI